MFTWYAYTIRLEPLYGNQAFQSSTANNHVASNAIDGNVTGTFDFESCSQTEPELRSWWSVDLQGLRLVYEIIIYVRDDTDGGNLQQIV